MRAKRISGASSRRVPGPCPDEQWTTVRRPAAGALLPEHLVLIPASSLLLCQCCSICATLSGIDPIAVTAHFTNISERDRHR